MIIRDIKRTEIKFCTDMYLDDYDNEFLPSNKKKAEHFLTQCFNNKCFFKVIEEDNKIVGWILALIGNEPHVLFPILRQQYFYTTLKGFKAVRAIILSHNEMLNYADDKQIKYAMSSSSHIDESFNFVKILEKRGWKRQGYIAVYEL